MSVEESDRRNGRLTPPPPLEQDQSIQAWIDLLDTTEQLVQAGFRRDYGPDAWVEPYRRWVAQQNDDHENRLISMLTRMSRAEKSGG